MDAAEKAGSDAVSVEGEAQTVPTQAPRKAPKKEPQKSKKQDKRKGPWADSKLKLPQDKKKPLFGGPFKEHIASNIVYAVLFILVALVCWLVLFGVPAPLSGKIPPVVLETLGIEDALAPKPKAAGPAVPPTEAQVVAQTTMRELGPALPINASVEDVVKSLRPESFLTAQDSAAYRAQSVVERIPHQKHAFWVMLATVYSATPDQGVGYLGIRWQAPDYYYLNGTAMDHRTFNLLQDRLRARVANIYLPDSTMLADGGIEFTNYGHIKPDTTTSTKLTVPKGQALIPGKDLSGEILALRTLAAESQVRFEGFDEPLITAYPAYKRYFYRLSTQSDYPSIFNFSEKLRLSPLRVGVLSFSASPVRDRVGNETMRSTVEFVLYTTP
jgi:hypothetical protein